MSPTIARVGSRACRVVLGLMLVLVAAPEPGVLAQEARERVAQENALDTTVAALAVQALRSGASALVVAVDVGGERVLSRGFGNSRPGGGPPDGDTSFHAGPLLSTFFSVAALGLAEDERLDLESALAQAFPDLPYGELGVRVEQLLTHTSGIPGYTELLRSARGRTRAADPKRILAWLQSGPLDATPGSCARYSNTNDFLLGLVLERASGRSLKEFLRAALFAPAEMEDTRFDCVPEPGAARVEQEFAGALEDQGEAPAPFEADELCSSAHDLLRFQRALVEGRLLAAPALELRASPARLSDGSTSPTGRGISLSRVGAFACESAGGGMAGQRVRLAYYPAFDATIVVWARGEDAPVLQLAEQVARTLLGLEPPEVRDLPMSAGMRARHVGDYYEGCTSHAITDEQEHLVLYPPDGPRTVLGYQGGEAFVARDDPDVRLEFELDGEQIVAFVLTEHGVSVRARRMY